MPRQTDNHLTVLARHGLTVKVRDLRQRQGWTVAALAHKAGIQTSHLSEKERGQARWSLLDLLKIAAALDVPLWHLVEIQPPPAPCPHCQKETTP